MKKCSSCQIDKDESEFGFHSKKTMKLKARCKECVREAAKAYQRSPERKEKNRQYYQKNRERVIARTKEYAENNPSIRRKSTKNFRARKYAEFLEFKKTLKCEKCGESDHNCLDFHHKDPDDRHDNISNLYHSTGKFRAELEKCIVLCANCHRKAHAYPDYLN